jgi:hypothetical protein
MPKAYNRPITTIKVGSYDIHFAGHIGPEVVSALLMAEPIRIDYASSASGNYDRIATPANNVSIEVRDFDYFPGTLEQYREQASAKTPADLVADLSATNDRLIKAEQTIAALTRQLDGLPPVELAEAAE